MRRIVAALRSPGTRWAFLGIAIAIAIYAVWANWADLVQAARQQIGRASCRERVF